MADEQDREQDGITPAVAAEITVPAVSEADLGKVRELVLRAHPDVVPDLVRGASIDELIASVEPARGAFEQIAERVRESATVTVREVEVSTPAPPAVPAGGTAVAVDPSALGPTTKIAQALAARKK